MDAVATCRVPAAPRRFLETTWETVNSAEPHRIAAAFSLGREEIIPDMFRCLIAELQRRFPERLTRFLWYLERHVEVDLCCVSIRASSSSPREVRLPRVELSSAFTNHSCEPTQN